MKLVLPFWQRLLLTILVMLGTSYLAGLAWQNVMGFPLPSYAAGAIGGLAALASKRLPLFGPGQDSTPHLSRARIAEAQQRRWDAWRAARASEGAP